MTTVSTRVLLALSLLAVTGSAFALTAAPITVAIPTLGPVGWGALLVLLAGAGFVALKRRKK